MKSLLAILLAAAALVPVAAAGQATLALDQAAPSFGDEVTFTITERRDEPVFVHLRCYQDARFVYDGFTGPKGEGALTLAAPGYWESGAADCVAELVYWNHGGQLRTLASTRFAVAA